MMFLGFCLSSCAGVQTEESQRAYTRDSWLILPFVSSTKDDIGVQNTQAYVETHLRSRGVSRIRQISDLDIKSIADIPKEDLEGIRYVVSGEISKWGFARTVNRKPEVGISLVVIDVKTSKRIWAGQIERQGRSSLPLVASGSVKSLIAGLNLVHANAPPVNSRVPSSVAVANGSRIDASPVMSTAIKIGNVVDQKAVQDKGNIVGKSTALFYGTKPAINIWSQFDRLILEAENITTHELAELKHYGAATFAYLSVGEVGPTRDYASDIDATWVLGENSVWKSKVMDLSNPSWIGFLLQQVDDLHTAGYQGIFMDTLDSYQLYSTTDAKRELQEAGIASFVEQVKSKYPQFQLIANRGFEVLPRIGQHLNALAAESLYASWNNSNETYNEVSANDRTWLLSKLVEAQSKFGMDVISIDYVDPKNKELARAVAANIAEHGFIPWVSNPALDAVGISSLEVLPREILMLFDSRVSGQQAVSEVHRFAATPLEYLGYVPVYHDIATAGIPNSPASGEYAGIVTWTGSKYSVPGVSEFIAKQIERGTPMAIFGSMGFSIDVKLSKAMGIKLNSNINLESSTISMADELIGYERPLPPRLESLGVYARSGGSENQVHLSIKDKNSSISDLVVTGPWGGYAAYPATLDLDVDGSAYWVIDPFAFLEKALKLPRIPMPDITSENGRRLWFSHIDGDALPSWAELPGKQLGAEVIEDRILKKYKYPHTISVVEGEMTSIPATADRRARMRSTMKRIFRMPTVELASHSYSHPYDWEEVKKGFQPGRYNLPIKGYEYSAEREVSGSVRFINEQLAPANKKVEVFLWSGEAVANVEAIAETYRIGIANLNGGNTTISKAKNTLTAVSPNAIITDKYVQPLAPIMNENIYTNNWLGPFDGFRRVIETLELTDSPRRLKPVNIYYHFYAGTKAASIRSMEEVYKWADMQETFPLYASEYARKVPGFRNAGVARYLDGSWKVSRLGSVRSLRVLDQQSWPVLQGSKGVVGARSLHDGVYIHTDGNDELIFRTSNRRPWLPYLTSSNAAVENWDNTGPSLKFRLRGHVPVVLDIGGIDGARCSVQSGGKFIQGVRTVKNTLRFKFENKDTGNAVLNCQA